MKMGWLVGLFILFIVLHLIAGVLEMNYMGAEEVSRIQILMQPGVIFTSLAYGPFAFLGAAKDYIVNLFNMLFFNYPTVFQGPWLIVKYAFFLPVSLGVIVKLVLSFVGAIR